MWCARHTLPLLHPGTHNRQGGVRRRCLSSLCASLYMSAFLVACSGASVFMKWKAHVSQFSKQDCLWISVTFFILFFSSNWWEDRDEGQCFFLPFHASGTFRWQTGPSAACFWVTEGGTIIWSTSTWGWLTSLKHYYIDFRLTLIVYTGFTFWNIIWFIMHFIL